MSTEARADDRFASRPDPAALTVAMAVAPGVYARNRMFAFFKDPEIRNARNRAGLLRGLVRHLAGSHGDVTALAVEANGERRKLRYRIERVHLDRAIDLSVLELACVTYLASRAGAHTLVPTTEDRALLEAALHGLSTGLQLPALSDLPT